MFDYDCPGGLTKLQVESALIDNGIACFYKCPVTTSVNYDKWCCTPAFPADIVDNNKTFNKCTTSGTDYSLELTVDKDCILFFNNSTKTSDQIAFKYATILGETDKTIDTIVKWSRLVPIPKVINDSDVAKYKMIMTDILNGSLINVISDKTQLIKTDNQNKNDDLLELTDSTASDKLHFLSEFRQDVIKRLCTLYGIPLTLSAKNTQILSSELHAMDLYSLYILRDRYLARKDNFDRAKKYMGFDFNFKKSEMTEHTWLSTLFDGKKDEEGDSD